MGVEPKKSSQSDFLVLLRIGQPWRLMGKDAIKEPFGLGQLGLDHA